MRGCDDLKSAGLLLRLFLGRLIFRIQKHSYSIRYISQYTPKGWSLPLGLPTAKDPFFTTNFRSILISSSSNMYPCWAIAQTAASISTARSSLKLFYNYHIGKDLKWKGTNSAPTEFLSTKERWTTVHKTSKFIKMRGETKKLRGATSIGDSRST